MWCRTLCDLTEHECDTVSKRIPSGLTRWHRCCDESRRRAVQRASEHTVDSEHQSSGACSGQISWLHWFLEDLDCSIQGPRLCKAPWSPIRAVDLSQVTNTRTGDLTWTWLIRCDLLDTWLPEDLTWASKEFHIFIFKFQYCYIFVCLLHGVGRQIVFPFLKIPSLHPLDWITLNL